ASGRTQSASAAIPTQPILAYKCTTRPPRHLNIPRHPSTHTKNTTAHTHSKQKKLFFFSQGAARMQTAKVKVKDAVSSAKEKAQEGSAEVQGKAGKAAATTHGEKEMAKEEERARKAQADAQKHQEKADAAAGRHGAAGTRGHYGPVGTPVAPDPAYPASGWHPAAEKYI
uniref:Uncharacterized protein n=1 Tax=Aegilops tauschii subsp. strangulata TaxID=200361 RepID=A0A453CWY5_AEGTS